MVNGQVNTRRHYIGLLPMVGCLVPVPTYTTKGDQIALAQHWNHFEAHYIYLQYDGFTTILRGIPTNPLGI
jgi:hypothetical protein